MSIWCVITFVECILFTLLQSDVCGQDVYTNLSIRLSSALEDAGVTWPTVIMRRKTYLVIEKYHETMLNLQGDNVACFHFGSQSEGTTTPGLNSDIDLLVFDNNVNVIRTWESWKPGVLNLLMQKDETLPPQQCLLQVTRKDSPEPETRVINYLCARVRGNKIVFASGRILDIRELNAYVMCKCIFTSGPSVSGISDLDVVRAFGIRETLPEIQYWIYRGRPGHWPTPELFEAARNCLCFLVPAGHPHSNTNYAEWRLSPNLIERLLMFSLNITQLKCYVVLKMIKKSLLNHVVEGGITSFHCKTVLLYTIEHYPVRLWREHNLLYLILSCLKTLNKWLRDNICPHYILSGVNLFDGKLNFRQCRNLHKCVNSLINNFPQFLFYIDIDRIGEKMMSQWVGSNRNEDRLSRRQICMAFQRKLDRDKLVCIGDLPILRPCSCSVLLKELIDAQRTFTETEVTNNRFTKYVAMRVKGFIFACLASVHSSLFIQARKEVPLCTLECYKCSFNMDTASNRLKLASVLFCSGHLHAASRVLRDVEQRCCLCVRNVCVCGLVLPRDRSLQSLSDEALSSTDSRLCASNSLLCVRFRRQEAYCVPPVLLFEMNRADSEEELRERDYQMSWMYDACVDAQVFLYYLQFLTYGGLGDRERQERAMHALFGYVLEHLRLSILTQDLYHIETALNLCGHCLEVEGNMDMAVDMYLKSVQYRPRNNAANQHLRRVVST